MDLPELLRYGVHALLRALGNLFLDWAEAWHVAAELAEIQSVRERQ